MAAPIAAHVALLLAALLASPGAHADDDQACRSTPGEPCYVGFQPDAAQPGTARYLVSALPAGSGSAAFQPTVALVALHGHGRDARRTFDAAMQTARLAGQAERVLVVAPLFQVAGGGAKGDPNHGCPGLGVPAARSGDLLWTCASWLAGEAAEGSATRAFDVLDALLQQLAAQWPGLQRFTVAGFSAGGQLVQRYVGFAEARAAHPRPVRYVVADPGTWLYFDAERPQPLLAGQPADWEACGSRVEAGAEAPGACTLRWRPADAACPAANRWKYGTEGLPASLGRSAAEARARYAAAELRYLQGGEDQGRGPGRAASVLDQSCAAQAQGPWRLQRGLAYAAYDRLKLAPQRPRTVGIAPGCVHDAGCVFTSPAGQAALLGP